MQKEERSTLINLEADILERGIVTALDSSQDLHDVLKFGTLDLDEKKVVPLSPHARHTTRCNVMQSTWHTFYKVYFLLKLLEMY